ncbi:hypothetical protein H6G76_16940 [Nostoc sp. FACHB-152]|uniref:hypothetical protein n=1 Tax=unclassified Nostoc TaxID=2593658 RepID=UPI00168969ED|nr:MULTISPECIES: hypothetical protein [unclassified Nostoc]MBD2448810.1 hypothetical protein [Nostoc sp. FACHB-152]MBD2467590.1 hypothetical protein [Nostoc sp. FACHB-145]
MISGFSVTPFRDIQKPVAQFLEPENFIRYRNNVAALNMQKLLVNRVDICLTQSIKLT